MASISTGVILLDSTLNLIASNRDAFQILAYPTPVQQISRGEAFLRDKVHTILLRSRKPGLPPNFVSEFRSGERRYSCGAYFLERQGGGAGPGVLLLLEREAQPFVDMKLAAAQFDLTPREQETVQHLLRGLTTKEIAGRMNISPSTVNAFLRLIMVKVGANNRSAVVRKILRPDAAESFHPKRD